MASPQPVVIARLLVLSKVNVVLSGCFDCAFLSTNVKRCLGGNEKRETVSALQPPMKLTNPEGYQKKFRKDKEMF